MENSAPGQPPKIELDLTPNESDQAPSMRRGRPVFQPPMPSVPKIEPIIGETDVGSDEAEHTVGIFFIVSAVPGLLSMVLGHGGMDLLGIAVPIYLGVGLIRGDDFVHQWVFAICLVNLVISGIVALAFPHSMLFAIGVIAQNIALLVLVSGKALSRTVYRISVGAVVIGALISVIGSFVH